MIDEIKNYFSGKINKKLIVVFFFIAVYTALIVLSITKLLQNMSLFIPMSILSISIIVGLFVSTAYVSREITDPIRQLYEATTKIKEGHFDVQVNVKTHDELEDLASVFNETTRALSEVREERKQIDNAKTQFISITSHELRSPMTPMKGQLQMLKQGFFGKLTEKQKESIDMVIRNANRLDNIIVDFLEISRIEAARLKFHFRKTDLVDTITGVVKYMEGFMPEKNITIKTDISPLPIIEVDPDRVSQVLRNLVNNAIKFTPKDGQITISAKKADGHILISVNDTGIGIKKEDQVKVFEPFFQAEQTIFRSRSGGTGLGLAICRGIIESQNGKLWLESEVGEGTTFYFTIPLKPVQEIQPIKVLFSSKELLENKLERVFSEMLGPIGPTEFNELRKMTRLTVESVESYIDDLEYLKVLPKGEAKDFKKKIEGVFEERKKNNLGKEKNGAKNKSDMKNRKGKKVESSKSSASSVQDESSKGEAKALPEKDTGKASSQKEPEKKKEDKKNPAESTKVVDDMKPADKKDNIKKDKNLLQEGK